MGRILGAVVIFAILLSVISFCASSWPTFRVRQANGEYGEPEAAFDAVELVCVIIFSAEYLARLVTVTAMSTLEERAHVFKWGYARAPAADVQAYTAGAEAGLDDVTLGPQPLPYAPLAWPSTWAEAKWCAARWWRGIAGFVLSPLNIIDFVAICPYYISVGGGEGNGSLVILRVLRLARVLRLVRLSVRAEGIRIMQRAFTNSMDILALLLFFVILTIVLFASAMFFAEGGTYDPDLDTFTRLNLLNTAQEETPFKSIPHAIWWAVVTITTTGYGDFFPTTPGGRAIAGFAMFGGVVVLALPITVISSSFAEEYTRYREEEALKKRLQAGEPLPADISPRMLESMREAFGPSLIASSRVAPAAVKPASGAADGSSAGAAGAGDAFVVVNPMGKGAGAETTSGGSSSRSVGVAGVELEGAASDSDAASTPRPGEPAVAAPAGVAAADGHALVALKEQVAALQADNTAMRSLLQQILAAVQARDVPAPLAAPVLVS